jgi:peptidyl-prolyl cis-trans isomerase B (cyclophilin B)
MKQKLIIILTLTIVLLIGGCGSKNPQTEGKIDNMSYKETEEITNYVKIEMKKTGDIMLLELYPDIAPITVANFQKLVQEKFYDGLIFHRIIKDFMIQGGDPEGTGLGGSSEKIKGEFRLNGVENNLKHERGVISMARSNDRDSASSQFFIVHQDASHLDGSYAAFGKMLAGFETLDKLANVKTDNQDKPIQNQEIYSIRFVIIDK